MPRLAADDVGSEDDVFEETLAEVDTDAKRQLNGELKDKIDEDEEDPLASSTKDDDEDAVEAKDKGEEGDEDDEEEGTEAFVVEDIRNHKFLKGELVYHIKWQGYTDKDNTWEPEEHLLPHSKQILNNYYKRIGGRPEPPIKRGKSKQSLREAPSTENLPASKRQKRNGADQPEEHGTWLPKGQDWEDQVEKVETIERSEETDQLMAYIRFKNGKRSKITMKMVYQHCPRPMLEFYEANLKFK